MTSLQGAEEQPAAPRVPDSMSLLSDLASTALDPEYAQAAARRAARGPGHTRTTPAARVRGRVALAGVAALLGLGVAAGAIALRVPQPAAIAARALLAEQITTRRGEADRLTAQIQELRVEVAELQADALWLVDSPLAAQLAADGLRSGSTAVTGPGLEVTLSDGPDLDDPEAAVQDFDLQVLVNGLWRAGAEAIAVNGQRLTSTTAIRGAGDAILVDLVPLVGPYRVEAIGDPSAMRSELLRSTAGQHLTLLGSAYGIGVGVTAVDDLVLSGAGRTTLRQASVPEGVELVPVPATGSTRTTSTPTTSTPRGEPAQ